MRITSWRWICGGVMALLAAAGGAQNFSDKLSNSPYGIAVPKGMDRRIMNVLHDGFKKGMDDPAYQKVPERPDQDNVYLNSEDYAKFAKQLNDKEKGVVERMGLKM